MLLNPSSAAVNMPIKGFESTVRLTAAATCTT